MRNFGPDFQAVWEFPGELSGSLTKERRCLEKFFIPNEEELRALAVRINREELLDMPIERLGDGRLRIVRQAVRKALFGGDRD